ncbi:MAG TPA: 6,7-dimethyl-8-ribityllumazine synthase [Methanocorpusculum sp.]|nr:6,7-dimethyl-8-ribityllumazine synthase [Methanocorpusculum sp.]
MTDKPVRFGFVVAEHNNRDTTHVPGVYGMPLAICKLLKKPSIGAVVTIGYFWGAANLNRIVMQQAVRKILDLFLKFNKPVALGISGPGTAIEYSKRAVESAAKMVRRLSE